MTILIERDDRGRFSYISKFFDSQSEIKEDFFTNVQLGTKNECWIWLAGKTGLGYGQYILNGKVLYAHRVSWMLKNGDIPKGLHVLHRCDNPKCVNPNHLYVGTHQQNMNDKKMRGRNPGLKGELSPKAKLTWEQVREMRILYSKGNISHRELAKKFGISNRMVSAIIRKDCWKE